MKIVKDAVLTYEVTGSASAAEQKLYSGMKKEHIPFYIEDRDWSFEKVSPSSVLSVSGLHITLDIPGMPLDLSKYSVYSSVNRNGVIDQR